MRIPREDDEDAEVIDMSSLLDVMFILIIFLLATTTFKQEERDIRVSLPTDVQGETLTGADKVIVVNVRKDGAYVLLGKQVTVEEMSQIVRESIEENSNQKVLIRADQEALHGYVARAVATCRHAGIDKANIGYQLPK